MTVSANTMPVDEIAIEKKCSKCGNVFPATAEFFSRHRCLKDGFNNTCKSCRADIQKEYYHKNKESIKTKVKKYAQKNKEKISERNKAYRQLHKKKISEYRANNKDKSSDNWKKYYEQNKKKLYEKRKKYQESKIRYKSKTIEELKMYDDVRQSPCGKYAEIKCAYCGKWVIPTILECFNRLKAINDLCGTERRIYCNNSKDGHGCREACPIYHKHKYPKGFRKGTAREVLPELRQMVFEYDDYTCQRCHITIKDAQLHAHHIQGAVKEPMLANDVTNVITLCKACHKLVHKQEGCSTHDYRRAECAA